MNYRFLLASLAAFFVFVHQAGAQTTQCNNGIDDDGDGGVDALIELPEYNGETYSFAGPGGVGVPHDLRAEVERLIREKKLQLTLPVDSGASLVRSDNSNWDYAGTFDTGVPHLPSLQQVCRIFGYRDYVASTCRDDERSGRYPRGKCNYHSTHDNYLWRFTGVDYVLESSAPQLKKTWIATITCQHKLAACNDGWDNDGDGKVDLHDPDCSSKNDNSERRKDPKCKSPAGHTEFEECRNSIDDDSDGAIDASDPGCWKTPGVPSSYDPNRDNEGFDIAQCKDGIDNDGDGAVDSADFSCSSPNDNDESNPKAQCQDGFDNDHDGKIDLADPGCTNNQDNDEFNPKNQCQDGIDNDGDGAVDMADFSCSSPDDNDESNPKAQCQDGFDNDHDGKIDLADPGCTNNQDNDEFNPKNQCQDGIDNDGDGAVDMADFSCSSPDDNDEANPKAQCQDGLDNDHDGKIDLADPGCSNAQDNNEYNANNQCQDGIDNDGDGAVDMADFSCSSPDDNDEANPKAQCQDGLDNDHDGKIDLADPGCSNAQDNNEYNANNQCQDGIDNDSDGAVDMADFSCSSPDDNDEANPKAQCQDGVDNDYDGKCDLADPGCSTAQDNDEYDSKTQCSDGIDNDGDGASDLADFSCSNVWDNDESSPRSQCQDCIDNDADGLIDLSDSGCSNSQDNDECNDAQAVRLGLDCVHNNQDGTYTAYFGYEYLGNEPLGVVTNPTLGTQNDIQPAPANRGQVIIFQPGAYPGSSAILFDGSPITWTVRTRGGGLSSVSASKSSPSCKPIQPRAECIQDSGKVVFGYSNPNPFSLRIDIGFLNSVYPAPISGAQPVTFLSGFNPAVFTTTIKGSAEWSLDGSLAKVTSATPGCGTGGCSTHNTGLLRDNIVYAAVQMGEVTKQALQAVHGSPKQGRLARAKAGTARVASSQIQREANRADDLVQKVIRLSSGIPELMYSCSDPAASCRTIDRGETLRSLANVYSLQLKQVSRLMNDKRARSAGVRSKLQTLVSKAQELKAQGESNLAQCPRFDRECR